MAQYVLDLVRNTSDKFSQDAAHFASSNAPIQSEPRCEKTVFGVSD